MTALDRTIALMLRNTVVAKLLVDAALGFGIELREAFSYDDMCALFGEDPPTMAIIEASALVEHPNAEAFVSRIDRLFLVLRSPDDSARHRFVGRVTTTLVCEPFDFEEVRQMLNAMRELSD